jgi:hypothetical protein
MSDWIKVMVGGIIFILLFITFGFIVGRENGYKDGQIDALTGKIVYCLERQANNELIWMYRKEGCEK